VYDSKKSARITISHLRIGPRPIHSSYLVKRANFGRLPPVRVLEKYDVLDYAAPGAVFLLNHAVWPREVWDRAAGRGATPILEKKLKST